METQLHQYPPLPDLSNQATTDPATVTPATVTPAIPAPAQQATSPVFTTEVSSNIQSVLGQIGIKRTLESHLMENVTKLNILNEIKAIPNYQDLKTSIELTLYVCKVVENLITKDHKIDKKQMVIDILKQAFPLTDDEINSIGVQIEFVHRIGKITKIKSYKWIVSKIGDWFKRKIL